MSDAATIHAEQVAYWNGPGVARWVTRQEQMDAVLAPVAEAALAMANVQPGERALDIGCGSGATSIALAGLVGPTGHVTGLDVSGPMIELARKRSIGIDNLDWVLADAATHGFSPGSTDLLFSRFGVMFFGDPVTAFANLRRALQPGGRLVFACWRPLNENPWILVPLQAVQPLVPPLPQPGREEPGPFAFGDPGRVAHILTAAGFSDPRFVEFEMDMVLGANLDDAVEQATSMGAASRALQGQPDSVKQAAERAVRNALVPYIEGGRVALPGAVWLVEGLAG